MFYVSVSRKKSHEHKMGEKAQAFRLLLFTDIYFLSLGASNGFTEFNIRCKGLSG